MSSYRRHRWSSNSDETPEILADVIRLREKVIELYDTDYPDLHQYTETLHHIAQRYQDNFRRATKGSRNEEKDGLLGGMLLGIAIYTCGASFLVAFVGAIIGIWVGTMSKSYHKRQMKQARKELKELHYKFNTMVKKMNDINNHIKEIFTNLHKLEQEDSDVSDASESEAAGWH